MRALEIMDEFSLLNWRTVQLGWRLGWVTKQDVIDYAMEWLTNNPEERCEGILLLAGGETCDEEEINDLLSKINLSATLATYDKDQLVLLVQGIEHPSEEREVRKELDMWRVAHLVVVSREDIGPVQKRWLLQELCCEFGHPEDMQLCSIYSCHREEARIGLGKSPAEVSNDTLVEMEKLIVVLKKRLGVTWT